MGKREHSVKELCQMADGNSVFTRDGLRLSGFFSHLTYITPSIDYRFLEFEVICSHAGKNHVFRKWKAVFTVVKEVRVDYVSYSIE